MAAVYRELEIEWEGKTYKVTPNYKMIQRIEQSISIAHLTARLREAPFSQLCDILSIALNEAGCKNAPSGEDLYLACHEDDYEKVIGGAAAFLIACQPQRKLSGNGAPPKTVGGAAGTSTGESTTGSPSGTSESSPPNSGG